MPTPSLYYRLVVWTRFPSETPTMLPREAFSCPFVRAIYKLSDLSQSMHLHIDYIVWRPEGVRLLCKISYSRASPHPSKVENNELVIYDTPTVTSYQPRPFCDFVSTSSVLETFFTPYVVRSGMCESPRRHHQVGSNKQIYNYPSSAEPEAPLLNTSRSLGS